MRWSSAARLTQTRRSRADSQFRVELPGSVERHHVVAAADMLAIDKDLRHRHAAAGAADHLVAPPRLLHQIDLGELNPFALQQGPGTSAIGAPHRAVHLNLGHRAGSPKNALRAVA